ncbi:5-dehydro-2-deoxygluconokinase [Hylemonella gracilis]|uniref:5-dehydro-2-deoxygluconokinase n=1 Tax=Hylemonella gracilis TaxID=80880 RepID=A0A4P6UMT3_9BURK|nr:5-dehydro-2-deoxygluconokinase [Hylemonella gracilis]
MQEYSEKARSFDVLCLGRAAVDLYGEQIGARLEDVQTFARYLGGSPANTAVGAARLGLRVGMISRVGDEHNGRFVREALQREGVDVSQVGIDPQRLTALVFLGLKDQDTFPLLFYRQHCADMGLKAEHVNPACIAASRALLISGTHLSHPDTRGACLRAMHAARAAGTRVVLDIDYRPVLWGLTSLGMGEQRYVASPSVSGEIQSVLPLCDLVVGTEEEVHIAGGSEDTVAALRRIRAVTSALIVMKRGPMGCSAFPGAIADDLNDAVQGPGFPIEVFNVLGAGDAFMAGLLRGWVRDEPLGDALRYANACGALVVSRHGCAPAMPSWIELSHFLAHGSRCMRLREDTLLEHLHRASTRAAVPPFLAILAFDHRAQLEDLAMRSGANAQRIARFKQLVAQAAEQGYALEQAEQRLAGATGTVALPGPGVIVDGRYGGAVLNRLTGTGLWIGRPVELPGSRPLAFEDGDQLALALRSWPAEQVVKCLLAHHPDDEMGLAMRQIASVQALARACQGTGHELLLELIPPRDLPAGSDTVARGVQQIYAADVRPDWWKLPPPDMTGWALLTETITRHDPLCRGVLLLGLEASEEQLWHGFRAAAGQPLCKGFAVGRTLFAEAASAWFAGELDDAGVVAQVATRYRRLIRLWQDSQAVGPEAAGTLRIDTQEMTP